MRLLQIHFPASRLRAAWMLLTLLALALFTRFAPIERTLGANARLVYAHGAWVWASLAIFLGASVAGLLALTVPVRREDLHAWSLALGRAGIIFWLISLPVSLLIMRLNWGGFYFDEPRWRIPFTFAVAGALLQTALLMISLPVLSSAANLVFGAGLLTALATATNILHPDSPILQSNAAPIQVFFGILLVISLGAAVQAAFWLRALGRPR